MKICDKLRGNYLQQKSFLSNFAENLGASYVSLAG